ncbi:MAG: hypothetical protein ACOCXT_03585 [Candidatus Dojkabacteria bacterium]
MARGLLQNADIYLLDEAFTGIDENTKAKVFTYLQGFLKTKTVIMVTHTTRNKNTHQPSHV